MAVMFIGIERDTEVNCSVEFLGKAVFDENTSSVSSLLLCRFKDKYFSVYQEIIRK